MHDRRHVPLSRFLVKRILRVDELEPVGHRWSLAKYAAAFFRNSFSIFSSRVSRSSSRSRARSLTVSGGSSPACSRRENLQPGGPGEFTPRPPHIAARNPPVPPLFSPQPPENAPPLPHRATTRG